jgi:DNA polymerase-3 subunit delta
LLYILAGPDDYSLTRALQQIKGSLGDAAALDTGPAVLDGQKVNLDELNNACQTIPFLADKRLVIIEGLIERFENGARTERPRGGRASLQQDAGPFAGCLAVIPESTVVILVEREIPNLAKGAFKDLAGKAEIKTFPTLKEPKLTAWAQQAVNASGASISAPALELLVQLTGSNLGVIANEIDKLAAYTGGRRIEAEDVHSLVGCSQDANVFAMIDAIVDFRAEAASQVLQQLQNHGAAPVYLLYMLDRQFRMIIRAQEMKTQRRPEAEIQSRLGLHNDFAYRRTSAQAGRYPSSRLVQIYRQLLEADLSIKTGALDSDLAVSLLVVQLCQRTPHPQAAPATGLAYGSE